MKKVISVILAVLVALSILPVNSYAVAVPSPGVIPFASLDAELQQDFWDYLNYIFEKLFSNDTHKITITGDDGQEYTYDYTSSFSQTKAFIDGNGDVLRAELDKAGDVDYHFTLVFDAAAAVVFPVLLYPLIKTVIPNAVSEYNKRHSDTHISSSGKIHGGSGAHRPGSIIDSTNSAVSSIKSELGLIDNGQSLFSDICAKYNVSFVYSGPASGVSFTLPGNSVSQYCYYVARLYDGVLYSLNYYSNSYTTSISVLYRNGRIGFIYDDKFYSSTAGEIAYNANVVVFKVPVSFFRNFQIALEKGISISDNDLVSIPGINFDSKSDLEKAAEMLAQQLGVDVDRILNEFKLVYDENGIRYFESVTGIRTAINDLVNAYNESIAGNAAIISSLEKLLEQLKAQNISGIEDILLAISGTLEGLNERDKDREALYGDLTGALDDLRQRLGELNLDDIGVISNNISDIKDIISSISISQEISIDETKLKTPATITTKFPFSLPFDLYHIFNVFSAEPVTPEFDVPFDMTSVGGELYNIHIELSRFDGVANIVRWLMYGVFIVGLIILTNNLIGRG